MKAVQQRKRTSKWRYSLIVVGVAVAVLCLLSLRAQSGSENPKSRFGIGFVAR
ncbi:MAG: hypothetical protein ACOYXA_04410 [Bacteroidota bacterium]